MGLFKERAAYIRGLADGMEMGNESTEQRVLRAMLTLLEEMAGGIDETQSELEALRNELKTFDQRNVKQADAWLNAMDEDEDYDDNEPYVHCPRCGEIFTPDLLAVDRNEMQKCPHCGHCFLVRAVVDEG